MLNAVTELRRLKEERMALVDMRNRIIRLYENPDFKAVILNEYMVLEVARFMEVAGNPNQNPVQRKDALDAAYAPGMLKRWLDARLMMGDRAEESIENIDDEILAEEQLEAAGEPSKYGRADMDDDEDDGFEEEGV